MRYPIKLVQHDGSYMVSFPDVPEALTLGETEEEALRHAVDALETALDFYFEAKVPVPMPSQPKRKHRVVSLPTSVAAKVLLYNEMLAQRVRPGDLARRIKVKPQEVTRMLNPRHATKIDTIATALDALGKRLELQLI